MKSLQQFKVDPLLEEEKTDYSKFDMLIRAGLANKAQLQRIHKILDKMHEERPQFNSADRQILQNLFNKMVDLLSNNKQIFQKTRQAIREEVELEESILDTTDYKLGPSGRKVKAHRIKVGDVGFTKDTEEDELKENISQGEPPFVLVLKRKGFRLYPNNLRVALYYNDRLDKYFSVPYIDGGKTNSVVQAEEHEFAVMKNIVEAVKNKETKKLVYESGDVVKVDYETASSILDVYNELNDENKIKLSKMVNESVEQFNKVVAFAISKQK